MKNHPANRIFLGLPPPFLCLLIAPLKAALAALRRLTDYGQIQALAGLFGQGCTAGVNVVSITPNGGVKPCAMMPVVVDNVRRRPFSEIWLRNPLLNKLRDRSNVKGWCASCRFVTECGGRRSRAYAYFGDLFASDPNCAKAPVNHG